VTLLTRGAFLTARVPAESVAPVLRDAGSATDVLVSGA